MNIDPAILVGAIILGAIVLIATIIALIQLHRRHVARRRAEMLAAASAAGFEEISDAKAQLKRWKCTQLSGGAKNITIGFRRTASSEVARETLLFEHRYVVSTGKSAHVVQHRVAAAPVSEHWPYVKLSPENVLTRLLSRLGFRDLEVEDEQFNARWRVKTKHRDFAELLLAPAVQKVLRDSPTSRVWAIEEGFLSLIESGALRPQDFATMRAALDEVLTAIPPELDAWEAALVHGR